MMATLFLQCVAPLQSWGTQSQYIVRDTGREPSKSGIIGLLCAALGVERNEVATINQLAQLTMCVRVDREGKVLRDYHTIFEKKVISSRYYLTDAMFLVGLEGNDSFLEQLQEALRRPRWTLFLGRKSCPPSRPPYLKNGFSQQSLHETLKNYPWLGQSRNEYDAMVQEKQKLRLIIDDDENGRELHNDLPVNFQRQHRRFQPRRTQTRFIGLPPFNPIFSYPLIK